MKAYTFSGIVYGYVMAKTKEEAIQLLKTGQFEDVIDLDSFEEASVQEEPELD